MNMAGLKFYERTKLLIELIEKKKTGSPAELAVKLGLKERMIYNVLDDLRLALGKEICYCKEEKSYLFLEKK
jgi:transcriptional antiterminator